MTGSSKLVDSTAQSHIRPDRLINMVMDYRASKILLVSVTYDIFTHINDGISTVEELCLKCKTAGRAMEILMDALVALGLLTKKHGAYQNTELTKTYLVKGRPHYLGHNIKYQEIIWDAWSQLKDVMREGEPRQSLGERLHRDPEFAKEYILGMADIAGKPACEIVDLIKPEMKPAFLLDVGSGPGAYAVAFMKHNPRCKAALMDLPATIQLAREHLVPSGFLNRIRFVPQNYHDADFGMNQYDYIIMSHITHDEGKEENRRLIQKSFRALKPGGTFILHDFMTDEEKTSPLFSALFSVHMLVYTKNGRVYTKNEYLNWIHACGFVNITSHDICKGSKNASTAIFASRPS